MANDCTCSEDPFPRLWLHRPITLPVRKDMVLSVRGAEVGPSSTFQSPGASPILTLASTMTSSLPRDQSTRRPLVRTFQLSLAGVEFAQTVSWRSVHCE